MNDIQTLWKRRIRDTAKELARYGKYIFNDHFKFALLFGIGAAAYYYQQWLQTIPAEFPAVFLMAVIVALALSYSPVYTFLKQADIVFLLPLETKMGPYFFKSGVVSFGLQLYVLVLIFAACAPLYLANGGTGSILLVAIGAAIITKIWNLASEWELSYYLDVRIRIAEKLVRFSLNVVFMFFICQGQWLFASIIAVLMGLLYMYMRSSRRYRSLKWDLLIHKEQKRMTMFYRIANMFTDVPSIQDTAKRRKYLDWLIAKIPFQQQASYRFLFWRTFLRTGDYLGIYMRLVLLGAALAWWVPYWPAKCVTVVLFIYFIGFQLSTLTRHHRDKIWLHLYPINERQKNVAVLSLIRQLLFIAAVFLPIPLYFQAPWWQGVLSLVVGVVFTSLYVSVFLKKRIAKAAEL
ncbi:ABC transporter permease [Aureibacillus halotolerans]|uniref:ABC-2 type transport system permease protein n=1 Tax=Aureibacillus halotolerans TaxID=1508390 RepID=A0A4R6U8E5_9BACI|nr:ABC transporter permease [Aureibacillus halotolerans]TDQ42002.1 ABC-2 type transport system permease protein [Aureibacillus halotolerans]